MDRSASHVAAHHGSARFRPSTIALATAGLLLAFAPTHVAHGHDAFPVTVVDDEGTSITLEARPERIISLSPANTETVYALGAGERLVGGSAFDDYPPEAVDLPDVATFDTGVVIEKVVELDPDLILAAGNAFTPPDDVARLRELGYPVVVLYAQDVEGVLADIELMGTVIGTSHEAAAITAGMSETIEAISAAAAAAGSRPRTYYELDWFEGATYGPALDSFVADMVELAGGEAITTGDPVVFEMPIERLVVADPQVIVLGDAMFGVCPEDVAGRAGWADMSALREGGVRAVDGLPITRPGPRLADGLAALALAIHPDLELADVPPPAPLCAAA